MNRIRIRMYRQGLGDCFLLTFPYDRPERNRHVLIDFGTTKRPEGATEGWVMRIAEDIRDECGGELDAIVVSHRHQDHISGFGDESGDVIASLNPKLVVQPWTEDPKAPPDAQAPSDIRREARHFQGLREAQEFVKVVRENLDGMVAGNALRRPAADDFGDYGEENLKNEKAVKNLAAMGGNGRADYVFYRCRTRLEEILPGVDVRILGPPTLKQSDEIQGARPADPEPERTWRRESDRGRLQPGRTSRPASENGRPR